MVWITKREMAYYFVLKHVFDDRIFNLGEVLDVLSLFGSKRTARRVIKRLVSRGLLERIGDMNYKVKSVEPALLASLKNYIKQRMYKRLKSFGLDVDTLSIDNEEKIVISGCNSQLRQLIDALRGILDIACT